MARHESEYKNNIPTATEYNKKIAKYYFEDKKTIEDLSKCHPVLLATKFFEMRKDLADFKTEHKIMKRILIEHGLWEELLDDDEFLAFLREDYEG